MLAELTIKQFLDKTAGNDPVPGGGSISALNAAIAASLAEMVGGLTIGRKKYAEIENEMKEMAENFEILRQKFVVDIDRDSDAYDRVFAAFKLPKETDEEKAHRTSVIQEETKYAAQVPMEVARATYEMLPQISAVARKGNSNAITDACVAMMCARTAILGALLNVRINLTSIKDEAFVKAMAEEADQIEKEAAEREKELYTYVKGEIGL